MEDEVKNEEIVQQEEEVVQEDESQEEDAQEQENDSKEESQEDVQKEEQGEEQKEDLAEKQRIYKERQERRKAEQAKLREQATNTVDNEQEKTEDSRLNYLENIARKIEHDSIVKQAKTELGKLEKEFVEAYPDYTDTVNDAIEFAKIRLVNSGMSESEALERIEYEKVMTADKAAARGEDPVEAVYKEAQSINQLLEKFAEAKGYVKSGQRKKTTLQKQRELSKPNAIVGGKGGRAVKQGLMEDGNDEIIEMTLADMLKAKKAKAL